MQTELAQIVQQTQGYRKPYFLFYLTHRCVARRLSFHLRNLISLTDVHSQWLYLTSALAPHRSSTPLNPYCFLTLHSQESARNSIRSASADLESSTCTALPSAQLLPQSLACIFTAFCFGRAARTTPEDESQEVALSPREARQVGLGMDNGYQGPATLASHCSPSSELVCGYAINSSDRCVISDVSEGAPAESPPIQTLPPCTTALLL